MEYISNEIIIKYSPADQIYIKKIISTIENNLGRLLSFFKLEKLSSKLEIVIWDSVKSYKNEFLPYLKKSNREYKEWMIADIHGGSINMMCIDAVKTTKNRETYDLEEFLDVMCHELVHICHMQSKLPMKGVLIPEMLATNLGNPNSSNIRELKTTADELNNNFDNIEGNYAMVYTFGRYLFDNYSNGEIYKIIEDSKNISRIFEEAKEWSIKTTQNRKR